MKQFLRDRPQLDLFGLHMLVMCTTNGWFKCEGANLRGPGFAASDEAIDPGLLDVIQVFAAEKANQDMVAGWHKEDITKSIDHESERMDKNREERRRGEAKRAENLNVLEEMDFISDQAALDAALLRGGTKGEKTNMMKHQIKKRTKLFEWKYPGTISTKLTCKKGQDLLVFLKSNLLKMMEHDQREERQPPPQADPVSTQSASSWKQRQPTVAAMEVEAEARRERAELQPQDDEELLKLEKEFLGKCLFDKTCRENKIWQVTEIKWRKYLDSYMWVLECTALGSNATDAGDLQPIAVSIDEQGTPRLDREQESSAGTDLQDFLADKPEHLEDIRADIATFDEKYPGKQPRQ